MTKSGDNFLTPPQPNGGTERYCHTRRVEKQKKEHAQQRNRCTPSSYISDEMIVFYLG